MSARNIFKCILNSQKAVCRNCTASTFVTQRHYRNRPSHNIGRTHGLVVHDKAPEDKKKVGIWKPDEVKSTDPTNFNTLNFVVSGYDLVLVENFATYIHRLLIKHKQNVTQTYAIPTSNTVIKKMGQVNSANVEQMDTDIALPNHKRVVQVKDLPSVLSPILLQQLMHSVPQSVSFTVKEYTQEDLEMRFMERVGLARDKEELQALLDSR
uniref:Small ribosomal subunit protein uS10 domain-containing protein n=1 Tax=Ciona savignyi TaxID=51511 RepID=H2Z1E4_CIOSA